MQVREWEKMGYDKGLWIFIYHLNPKSPYFHQTMIIRLQLFSTWNPTPKPIMWIGFTLKQMKKKSGISLVLDFGEEFGQITSQVLIFTCHPKNAI